MGWDGVEWRRGVGGGLSRMRERWVVGERGGSVSVSSGAGAGVVVFLG